MVLRQTFLKVFITAVFAAIEYHILSHIEQEDSIWDAVHMYTFSKQMLFC